MHDLNTLMKTDPKEGVRRLCEAYGGLVFFAVRRVLRGFSDDDAEECVSDVFLYLYRHRKRLDFEGAAFKSYLIKTATHIAQDHVRRSKRMPVPTDELWDATESERSAEELAIANMEGEALLQAIRSLGEPDATILYLKYGIGMRITEIADMLGMKPNTAAQRACRALKRLREQWKGENENE